MSKNKMDNFKKAAFDMFGVGSDGSRVSADSKPKKTLDEKVDEILDAEPVSSGEIVSASRSQQSVSGGSAPYVLVPATYLAPGTVMEGTLHSKGDVEIAGTFKGDIFSEGDVTLHTSIEGNVTANNLTLIDCSVTGDCTATALVKLDANSSIKGNIVAAELSCSGSIVGDINVRGNVAFESTAIVDANIGAGSIAMERGAKISGKLNMRG